MTFIPISSATINLFFINIHVFVNIHVFINIHCVSSKVVGKGTIKVHVTRSKGGLGIHWNFA